MSSYMLSEQKAGPEFLGIGSSRCGTTFLHQHLRTHPELQLSPIKELHYFDTQRGAPRLNRRSRKHLPKIPGFLFRVATPGGMADLGWALRYFCGARTDEWYLSLFPHREGRLRGEITPAYCALPEEDVRRIHDLLPQARIVFMMRDPIDRAWSVAVKSLARARNRSISEVDVEDLHRRLQEDGLYRKSDYRRTIEVWEDVFGPQQLFCGFLEEIRDDPVAFLDRLCDFLGVKPHPLRDRIAGAAPVNTTAAHGGGIPPVVERRLAAAFIEMNAWLAQRYGGYPQSWLERCQGLLNTSPEEAR